MVHASTNLPLGEKRTHVTARRSSSIIVLRHWPVPVSQMRMRPSPAHDASSVPARVKSTPPTGSECAGRARITRAARTSHRKTASSKEPDTSMLPLGEKARL